MTPDEFLKWEKETPATIDLKLNYIDVAGDFKAGVLLSQIIYWNLPSKAGKSKLRVFRGGRYWIAKTRRDWYVEMKECGLGQTKLILNRGGGKVGTLRYGGNLQAIRIAHLLYHEATMYLPRKMDVVRPFLSKRTRIFPLDF